jgi:hypothetical protein
VPNHYAGKPNQHPNQAQPEFHGVDLPRNLWNIYPNDANAGGLQNPGVVFYFEPLTTQKLKFSGVPDVLGRSSRSEAQRVNNMAK